MGMSFKDKERLDELDKIAYEMFKEGRSLTSIGSELKVKRQLLSVRLKKKYGIEPALNGKKSVNRDFFKTITEQSMYWLGYIFADGSICDKNYLEIVTKDAGHLEKFKKAIGSAHKISEKKVGDSIYFRISIKDQMICEDLRAWGVIPRKSFEDIQFPDIPKAMICHFLRGFFDGDGNFYIRRQTKNHYPYANFNISFYNQGFAERLVNLLSDELNIPVKLDKQQTCLRVRTRTKASGLDFIDFIYSNSTIYLERKFEQVKTFLPS